MDESLEVRRHESNVSKKERVSILVLLDESLEDDQDPLRFFPGGVSILVLLDESLEDYPDDLCIRRLKVSILVLLDESLEAHLLLYIMY